MKTVKVSQPGMRDDAAGRRERVVEIAADHQRLVRRRIEQRAEPRAQVEPPRDHPVEDVGHRRAVTKRTNASVIVRRNEATRKTGTTGDGGA